MHPQRWRDEIGGDAQEDRNVGKRHHGDDEGHALFQLSATAAVAEYYPRGHEHRGQAEADDEKHVQHRHAATREQRGE